MKRSRPEFVYNKSMANGYVEQKAGGYCIRGTRVSLDSVICAFLRGDSPESIRESFPSLSLEQVYGAITFYLANQPTVDAYLKKEGVGFRRQRSKARRKHPLLHTKLERARHAATLTRR